MARYRLAIHVGPVRADLRHWARWLKRTPGIKVVSVGTERILVDVSASRMNGCAGAKHNLSALMYRKYKTDYGVLRAHVGCAMRRRDG